MGLQGLNAKAVAMNTALPFHTREGTSPITLMPKGL